MVKKQENVFKLITKPIENMTTTIENAMKEGNNLNFNIALRALCNYIEFLGKPNYDYTVHLADSIAAEFILLDTRHIVMGIDDVNNTTSKLEHLTRYLLDVITDSYRDVANPLIECKDKFINYLNDVKVSESSFFSLFYKAAFPRKSEYFGVVYTPRVAVSFMNYSTEDILKMRFGVDFNDPRVFIEDPFAGANIYIKDLLEGGSMTKDTIIDKYVNGKISYNEIGVSAYFNSRKIIESTFQKVTGEPYVEFRHGFLRNTFGISPEDYSNFKNYNPDESILVIIGNPPYRVGQKNANDDLKNDKHW